MEFTRRQQVSYGSYDEPPAPFDYAEYRNHAQEHGPDSRRAQLLEVLQMLNRIEMSEQEGLIVDASWWMENEEADTGESYDS